MVEKKKKEVRVVGVAYISLEFLLDYRKDNLMILVIRYFFPYQGLIFSY